MVSRIVLTKDTLIRLFILPKITASKFTSSQQKPFYVPVVGNITIRNVNTLNDIVILVNGLI